jgi:uncharacterized membrane protein
MWPGSAATAERTRQNSRWEAGGSKNHAVSNWISHTRSLMQQMHGTCRRPPTVKTALFIATAVIANSFGNLLLALGMDRMPAFTSDGVPHYAFTLVANPFVLPGALLSAVYTLAQLSLFSWADLSYVIPCTAASYVLTTALSKLVMHEHVAAARWAGVLLICVGVIIVARTPTRTVERSEEPGQ